MGRKKTPSALQTELLQVTLQQPVGQLGLDPGAVAGQAVGGHRAAVRQVDQGLEGHFQDAVAAASVDVGHEASAAATAFVARIVEA